MTQTTAAPAGQAFILAFLTDEWAWEDEIEAPDQTQAVARARGALETVVREEGPSLACVTLLQGDRKLGVWDWIDGRPFWTPWA